MRVLLDLFRPVLVESVLVVCLKSLGGVLLGIVIILILGVDAVRWCGGLVSRVLRRELQRHVLSLVSMLKFIHLLSTIIIILRK